MKFRIENQKLEISKAKGVTLIELLMIIAILVILSTFAIPTISNFQKESDLNDNTREIINNLELARSRTLASEEESKWGIYFTTSTTPHHYSLFKGESFATGCLSQIFKLSETIEFSEINFNGGNEIIFERVTGETYQPGMVSLRVKTDPNKSRTIYVEPSGKVELSTSSVSDANRITDSRHIHFNYIREISTTTEKLILDFGGEVTEEIIISDFIEDGQISLEREVDVGGDLQIIKITTHRLNNPDTQFSIHRDRRYNNKPLSISLSGDGSGNLISYTAQGEESRGTSIYLAAGDAGDPQRQ